jgi:hypothetical protein
METWSQKKSNLFKFKLLISEYTSQTMIIAQFKSQFPEIWVAIIGWSTVVTLQCLHEKEVSRVVTFAIFESCYEPVGKVGSSIVVKAFWWCFDNLRESFMITFFSWLWHCQTSKNCWHIFLLENGWKWQAWKDHLVKWCSKWSNITKKGCMPTVTVTKALGADWVHIHHIRVLPLSQGFNMRLKNLELTWRSGKWRKWLGSKPEDAPVESDTSG